MSREICVIHANCQGDALKELLEASPDFARKFEIIHLRNYGIKHLDQGLLDSCSLFLHQHLTPKWGEISTEQVLGRLSPKATSLCIPNCFFKGYWPMHMNRPDIIEFADELLEKLLALDLDQNALMSLYMKASPALCGDIESIAAESLAIEREKETHSPIKYVDWIAERWRSQQLFLTINHPGPQLLTLIAQQILQYLGLGPIPKTFADNYIHPHNEFWQPIHPEFGKRLGLKFADAKRKYPCFGHDLTHYEYTICYLACRACGTQDLPSALANVDVHGLSRKNCAHN